MNSKHADFSLQDTRVIGVYAHIDAGKTTTSEAILYFTGRIHRLGSVDDGDTQLDWMEQERQRGITITAAATACAWHGTGIHLIDTPGHIDFTAEVMRSIRVIDGAVIVLCGVGGVETQTETVWRHADRQDLPRLIFVNKMDRETADFGRVLADVRLRLTPHAVPLQVPIRDGDELRGVVDLLSGVALRWPAGAEEPVPGPVPAGMAEAVRAQREALLDAVCETDEALLRRRLDGEEIDLASLQKALRRATVAGRLVPVLCGSARRRIGIQPLLDAVGLYLPAPSDRPPLTGTVPGSEETASRPADPDAPFCATVFKIVSDPHVGHLAWARVFSGRRSVGETLTNPRTSETERLGRIYRIHANRREGVEAMRAGDVVALVGIKSAVTGDTLCQPGHPLALEPFRFPEPVISVALSPSSDDERDRLQQAVSRLCEEDPTLAFGFDPATGEQILSGMGELHLEIAVDRLRSEYELIARTSPLQVAYRETVRRKAEATGNYRKQTGGHGHFAVVRLRVEPLAAEEGIVFLNKAPSVELPEMYARGAEAGAREALAKGIVAGFPVTGLRVTLVGGRFHEIDSNSMDFRIAGSMGVREAVRQAGATLLEPVMLADINVDEEYLGPVAADFCRRRGVVGEMHARGRLRNILGEVPLAEARGYATDLRSMTQGRGTFTLEFRRYARVPDDLAGAIIAERQEAGKVERR